MGRHILVVVDMQNDFVDGALGSPQAMEILPRVADKIKNHQGGVILTRDTHGSDYMDTREGKYLPVPHCVKDTHGWQIHPSVASALPSDKKDVLVLDKPTFGSVELMQKLQAMQAMQAMQAQGQEPIQRVTLVGLCTDICVISNAMLIKAALPEIDVVVDASCCAGVTRESHENALNAMRACQILIENG